MIQLFSLPTPIIMAGLLEKMSGGEKSKTSPGINTPLAIEKASHLFIGVFPDNNIQYSL